MHVYAQFSFLWKSTKFKKIQIQFLEHREVIRPWTKNKSCSTFYRLSFKPKKSGKNAYAYSWRHFEKKIENNFFSSHQVALESWNYDHSTPNRKLHQTVVTVCFRKISPLTVTFHSTNLKLQNGEIFYVSDVRAG